MKRCSHSPDCVPDKSGRWSEAKGEEQTEKGVYGGGERYGNAIGSGKTVSGDGGTHRTSQKDASVCEEEEGGPENGGACREMVLEMAGERAKF